MEDIICAQLIAISRSKLLTNVSTARLNLLMNNFFLETESAPHEVWYILLTLSQQHLSLPHCPKRHISVPLSKRALSLTAQLFLCKCTGNVPASLHCCEHLAYKYTMPYASIYINLCMNNILLSIRYIVT